MPVLTVLVIDDSELHQRVARACLERAGHRVKTVSHADDAEPLLAGQAASVVVVSATLPESERRAAVERAMLRRRAGQKSPTLPPPVVLIAAGDAQRPEADDLLAKGATGVIPRPYEPDRLAAHVELYSLGAAPAKVLIVDDSPTQRHANAATVRAAGHEVFEAADGQAALDLLDRTPGIDLVLTDVLMPGIDGYRLVQAIRERENGALVPVVMLTALDDVGSQSRAIEVGADDVLAKPIQPAELRARLRAILRLKTLQQRLVSRNQELAVALQLREDLTSLVVHDFKNPLSIVLGSADLIAWEAERLALTNIQDMAGDIVNSALRLKNFTETLLEVARLEGHVAKPKPTRFAIAALLDGITGDLRRTAERVGVALTSSAPADLAVYADRDWIYRVLQNLVDNALKHSPAATTIEVSATRDPSGLIRVDVADRGPGIPAEFRERIFDKFAQLEGSERKGTGLGLAFCRMAVEAHGGWIRVLPREGQGAVFAFTLPSTPREA